MINRGSSSPVGATCAERFSSLQSLCAMALIALLLVACSAEVAQRKTPARVEADAPAERRESLDRTQASTPVSDPAPADASRQAAERNSSADFAVEEVIVTGAAIQGEPVLGNSASLSAVVRTSPPQLHYPGPHVDQENYLEVNDNPVRRVSEQPVSTFSIDVDTAAYSNLRRMLLREGRLPPKDAVRLEEMINYFDYDYPIPDSAATPLAVNSELMPAPWNPANRLMLVGIKGYKPELETRPNANLVFLVDVSGSMRSSDKLGLVQRSLKLLVEQMQDSDRIALVVYAGAAGMVLDSTPASEKLKITHAIDSLSAGGSTNGAAGIQLAYHIAEANLINGGINRVLIASDGDLNVGMTGIDELEELIARKRDNGVALTTLGFGSGNYNYSLLERIADVGNGNAAYIDSLNEARKVLVEEMQSTLLTIASDVKIQIEFNPTVVSEYRLLGYENRLLNREDFLNDRVDAGEIGAGHTVTALYEITLKGSDGGYLPPSRYAREEAAAPTDFADELAYVKIRYKLPDAETSTEMAMPVMGPQDELAPGSDTIRFAAAVAGFGQLLQGGKYTRDWDYDQLLQLARDSRGADPHGYRSELLNLIEVAKLL